MLFNTLTYAKFFALVFAISWLLVRRRWAPILPWFLVLGHVATQPTKLGGVALVVTLLGSLGLISRSREDERPATAVALGSVLLNLGGLWLLCLAQKTAAPGGWALTKLGVAGMDGGVPSLVATLVAAGLGYAMIRARQVRMLLILGASYVFYAHWDWRFLPLIFGSSTIDWLLGLAIGRETNPRRRKLWLLGTVIVNLGVLGFFKYFNFGIDTARALLAQAGVELPAVALEIALPVGISFFTFESMSYVIDVYRRDLPPHKSYLEYLSFVAFFPHLVAGPIVRPRDLLPQLSGAARFNPEEASEALFLIGLGLFKKVAIGDYLALNLVDRVFDAPWNYSSLECYAAVVSYAIQIYCDFSGYTDIAIGSALLLGVRFPLNFNSPYKADSIQDFWRRWHISLSTWLRDYLYIPLGGNRKGQVRTYVNLMLTMLLGGLWHGASWAFVVWGGLHGLALALNRWWQRRSMVSEGAPSAWWVHTLKVLLTFHFVCLCWVFFRADSFVRARGLLQQIAEGSTHHSNLPLPVLAVMGLGLCSHFVPDDWYKWTQRRFVRSPALVQGLALFLCALALRKLASAEAVPFVYFQF